MDGALWMYALLVLGTAPPLVPNSAMIASAGAMAAVGDLSLPMVLLVVAGSAILGDAAVYGLGRLSSARALRFLSRSHRSRMALEWTAHRLHAHGLPFVIGVRFLPSGRVVGGLSAAIVRYPARRYLLGALIAEVIWASYSVGLGYWGGAALHNSWVALGIGAGVSALVAGVAHLLSLRSRERTARTRAGSRVRAAGGPAVRRRRADGRAGRACPGRTACGRSPGGHQVPGPAGRQP
ncbi:DedA family protein [Streptomyces sp. B6B3]|uniref:DedA family protein n=1 Tax=Streptomyces sp. B6B3 TaxID=3153570 RepID=UPI00325C5609